MVSLKNNDLKNLNSKQLCKLHNGKEIPYRRTRLYISKSHNFAKSYHPLKQKKIKLHRLKFVSCTGCAAIADKSTDFSIKSSYDVKILSKKYTATPIKISKKQSIWSTENDIIEWLLSINVDIRRKSQQKYFLKNRICFLNNVLVFANKKRIEMGLDPFYLDGLTEF